MQQLALSYHCWLDAKSMSHTELQEQRV